MSSKGHLLTRGPGAYKIPGFGNVPQEFNVTLLKDVPNVKAVYSSKVQFPMHYLYLKRRYNTPNLVLF